MPKFTSAEFMQTGIGDGIELNGGDLMLSDTIVGSNFGDGIHAAGIVNESGSGCTVSKVSFVGNRIENNDGDGIELAVTDNSTEIPACLKAIWAGFHQNEISFNDNGIDLTGATTYISEECVPGYNALILNTTNDPDDICDSGQGKNTVF